VASGWTRREAVLWLYLAGCGGGALAIFVSVAEAYAAYSLLAVVILFALWLIYRLEQVKQTQ
jgi:hypothetical protein